MQDIEEKKDANRALFEAAMAGTREDILQAIADGADPNAVEPVHQWSAAMIAASTGDPERLKALKEAGADFTQVHGGQSVASVAAGLGKAATLNYAIMNNSSLAGVDISAIADPQCRETAITALREAQTEVEADELDSQIKKTELGEQKKSQPPTLANLAAYAAQQMFMRPVDAMRVAMWRKERPDYLLQKAVDATRKHEARIEAFKNGPMAGIMADLGALGNTPADIEHALRNTQVGKQLNIAGRMEALDQDQLRALDRERKSLASDWKNAIKVNTAAGRDISAIAEKELGSLAKATETMPRKVKDDGKVEFMGDKFKEMVKAMMELVDRIVNIVSRLAGRKAPAA